MPGTHFLMIRARRWIARPDGSGVYDPATNLTAPAPTTPDGKPDFSGMWVSRDEPPCDVNER
jgi:hypothetical protein